MSEIGRQRWQERTDVGSGSVRENERLDGEAVPQVVRARAAAARRRRAPEARIAHESGEGPLEASMDDLMKYLKIWRRRLTRIQSWAPRSSLPGSFPVATPFSNVTDPRLIV